MTAKERFRRKFWTEGLRTYRLARVFVDGDLALRPGNGSMSTAELLAHVVSSRNFLRGVFQEGEPRTELFRVDVDASTVAAARQALAQSWRAVLEAIDATDEERLNERIAPFGPQWEMTRLAMAELMLEHEMHHRGQLSVYARVAGHVPPDMYAPVSEEVLDESPRG